MNRTDMSVLPEGWFNDPDEVHEKHLEYFRELPPLNPQLHVLAGIPVRLLGYRNGNDDILLQLLNSDNFCVVHLTYLGRQEIADHPMLEFSGSFEELLAWDEGWGKLEHPRRRQL